MTLQQTSSIVCDMCGAKWAGSHREALRSVRRESGLHGWTRRKRPTLRALDLCEQCSLIHKHTDTGLLLDFQTFTHPSGMGKNE